LVEYRRRQSYCAAHVDDDHSAGAVVFSEGATVSRTGELIVLVVGLVLAVAWLAYSVRKLLESIKAIYRLKAAREQKSFAPRSQDVQQESGEALR
jgi:hypothetical protein